MATLTKDNRTGGFTIQWYDDKRRFSVFLGSRKYSQKTAEKVKEMVETLIWYRNNGQLVPAKSVTDWLGSAPAEIKTKLAKVGLIAVHEPKTCKHLWDAFLKHKKDAKWKTMKGYLNCQSHFLEAFSATEALEKITSERLLEWKSALRAKLAEASAATYLKITRTVLNFATDKKRKWLTDNPMDGIPLGSFVNEENNRTINMEEYAKLLDACPNQEWRTIIALARIGGLRCPSELKRLKWSDVNWAENRFLVRSPKTEHHEGKSKRIVPLFQELRSELDRHFIADESIGNIFVIQGLQGTTWKLHEAFQKIADKAGLGTIIRPFDNMRMSRSNEILNQFNAAYESIWIGHSQATMRKHYLSPPDEVFAKAAGVTMVVSDEQKVHAKLHAIR